MVVNVENRTKNLQEKSMKKYEFAPDRAQERVAECHHACAKKKRKI
jgi:hypothetical protein